MKTTVCRVVRQVGHESLVEPETFTSQTMVLPCADPESGIRVDFVFSFSPYEQAAIERVRRTNIGGPAVSFTSPEDLVIHRVVAGRPRDPEDVKSIGPIILCIS